MSEPLVSVITPTYNRAALLVQAIESVRQQEYPNWEMLVIDDGSTDETSEILDRYAGDPRIRTFRQENQGQATARNEGLRNARGDYVGFLDSDNRWLPHKLRVQVSYLLQHPDVDVVYGENEEIDLDGVVCSMQSPMKRHSGTVWRELLVDNFVTFNTALIRAKKIRLVNGLDPAVRRGDDYDLWLRLSPHATFQCLPDTLAQYRVAGNRISDNIAARFESNLAAIHRFLAANQGLITGAEFAKVESSFHARFARAFAERGDFRNAWTRAFAALRLSPFELRHWRTLLAVLARAVGWRSR